MTIQPPKITALVLGISAVAALFATPAQADDAKVYPGVMCQPTTDDYYVTRFYGRAMNNKASTISLECPVVRDVMAQEICGGSVWVLDQTNTGSVSCTLAMIIPTSGGAGSVSGWFSTRSSSYAGFNSSPQKLSDFSALGWADNGAGVMRCTVPAKDGSLKSGVTSYRISEDD